MARSNKYRVDSKAYDELMERLRKASAPTQQQQPQDEVRRQGIFPTLLSSFRTGMANYFEGLAEYNDKDARKNELAGNVAGAQTDKNDAERWRKFADWAAPDYSYERPDSGFLGYLNKIVEQQPFSISSMVEGGLGTGLGSVIGGALGGPAGAYLGGMAGGALTGLHGAHMESKMEESDTIDRLLEKGMSEKEAFEQGKKDYWGNMLWLAPENIGINALVGGLWKPAAAVANGSKELIKQGIKQAGKNLGKELLLEGMGEGVEEVYQSGLKRYVTGDPMMSPEALSEYAEGFKLGAGGGILGGGMGKVVNRSFQKIGNNIEARKETTPDRMGLYEKLLGGYNVDTPNKDMGNIRNAYNVANMRVNNINAEINALKSRQDMDAVNRVRDLEAEKASIEKNYADLVGTLSAEDLEGTSGTDMERYHQANLRNVDTSTEEGKALVDQYNNSTNKYNDVVSQLEEARGNVDSGLYDKITNLINERDDINKYITAANETDVARGAKPAIAQAQQQTDTATPNANTQKEFKAYSKGDYLNNSAVLAKEFTNTANEYLNIVRDVRDGKYTNIPKSYLRAVAKEEVDDNGNTTNKGGRITSNLNRFMSGVDKLREAKTPDQIKEAMKIIEPMRNLLSKDFDIMRSYAPKATQAEANAAQNQQAEPKVPNDVNVPEGGYKSQEEVDVFKKKADLEKAYKQAEAEYQYEQQNREDNDGTFNKNAAAAAKKRMFDIKQQLAELEGTTPVNEGDTEGAQATATQNVGTTQAPQTQQTEVEYAADINQPEIEVEEKVPEQPVISNQSAEAEQSVKLGTQTPSAETEATPKPAKATATKKGTKAQAPVVGDVASSEEKGKTILGAPDNSADINNNPVVDKGKTEEAEGAVKGEETAGKAISSEVPATNKKGRTVYVGDKTFNDAKSANEYLDSRTKGDIKKLEEFKNEIVNAINNSSNSSDAKTKKWDNQLALAHVNEKINDIKYPISKKQRSAAGYLVRNNMVDFTDSESGEKSKLAYYSMRTICTVNVNGFNIPFYISSGFGGKSAVASNQWYPFFGMSDTGNGNMWLNKASEEEISAFYGSPMLRAICDELNKTYDPEKISVEDTVSLSKDDIDNIINSNFDKVAVTVSPKTGHIHLSKQENDKMYDNIGEATAVAEQFAEIKKQASAAKKTASPAENNFAQQLGTGEVTSDTSGESEEQERNEGSKTLLDEEKQIDEEIKQAIKNKDSAALEELAERKQRNHLQQVLSDRQKKRANTSTVRKAMAEEDRTKRAGVIDSNLPVEHIRPRIFSLLEAIRNEKNGDAIKAYRQRILELVNRFNATSGYGTIDLEGNKRTGEEGTINFHPSIANGGQEAKEAMSEARKIMVVDDIMNDTLGEYMALFNSTAGAEFDIRVNGKETEEQIKSRIETLKEERSKAESALRKAIHDKKNAEIYPDGKTDLEVGKALSNFNVRASKISSIDSAIEYLETFGKPFARYNQEATYNLARISNLADLQSVIKTKEEAIEQISNNNFGGYDFWQQAADWQWEPPVRSDEYYKQEFNAPKDNGAVQFKNLANINKNNKTYGKGVGVLEYTNFNGMKKRVSPAIKDLHKARLIVGDKIGNFLKSIAVITKGIDAPFYEKLDKKETDPEYYKKSAEGKGVELNASNVAEALYNVYTAADSTTDQNALGLSGVKVGGTVVKAYVANEYGEIPMFSRMYVDSKYVDVLQDFVKQLHTKGSSLHNAIFSSDMLSAEEKQTLDKNISTLYSIMNGNAASRNKELRSAIDYLHDIQKFKDYKKDWYQENAKRRGEAAGATRTALAKIADDLSKEGERLDQPTITDKARQKFSAVLGEILGKGDNQTYLFERIINDANFKAFITERNGDKIVGNSKNPMDWLGIIYNYLYDGDVIFEGYKPNKNDKKHIEEASNSLDKAINRARVFNQVFNNVAETNENGDNKAETLLDYGTIGDRRSSLITNPKELAYALAGNKDFRTWVYNNIALPVYKNNNLFDSALSSPDKREAELNDLLYGREKDSDGKETGTKYAEIPDSVKQIFFDAYDVLYRGKGFGNNANKLSLTGAEIADRMLTNLKAGNFNEALYAACEATTKNAKEAEQKYFESANLINATTPITKQELDNNIQNCQDLINEDGKRDSKRISDDTIMKFNNAVDLYNKVMAGDNKTDATLYLAFNNLRDAYSRIFYEAYHDVAKTDNAIVPEAIKAIDARIAWCKHRIDLFSASKKGGQSIIQDYLNQIAEWRTENENQLSRDDLSPEDRAKAESQLAYLNGSEKNLKRAEMLYDDSIVKKAYANSEVKNYQQELNRLMKERKALVNKNGKNKNGFYNINRPLDLDRAYDFDSFFGTQETKAETKTATESEAKVRAIPKGVRDEAVNYDVVNKVDDIIKAIKDGKYNGKKLKNNIAQEIKNFKALYRNRRNPGIAAQLNASANRIDNFFNKGTDKSVANKEAKVENVAPDVARQNLVDEARKVIDYQYNSNIQKQLGYDKMSDGELVDRARDIVQQDLDVEDEEAKPIIDSFNKADKQAKDAKVSYSVRDAASMKNLPDLQLNKNKVKDLFGKKAKVAVLQNKDGTLTAHLKGGNIKFTTAGNIIPQRDMLVKGWGEETARDIESGKKVIGGSVDFREGVPLVTLVKEEANNFSQNHEMLHIVYAMFTTEKEKQQLAKMLGESDFKSPTFEEKLGDYNAKWASDRAAQRRTLFGKIRQQIADWCANIKRALRGYNNGEDILRSIESGDIYNREEVTPESERTHDIKYSAQENERGPNLTFDYGEKEDFFHKAKGLAEADNKKGRFLAAASDLTNTIVRNLFDSNEAVGRFFGQEMYRDVQKSQQTIAGKIEDRILTEIVNPFKELGVFKDKALREAGEQVAGYQRLASLSDRNKEIYDEIDAIKNDIELEKADTNDAETIEQLQKQVDALEKKIVHNVVGDSDVYYEKIQNILEKQPKAQQVADHLVECNKINLEKQHDSGLISDEFYNTLIAAADDVYVPLVSTITEDTSVFDFNKMIEQGLMSPSQEMARIKKAGLHLNSITAQTISAIGLTETAVARHNVQKEIVNCVEANPEQFGDNFRVADPNEVIDQKKEAIFSFTDDGHTTRYVIDKGLAEALNLFSTISSNGPITRLIKATNNILKTGVTAAPRFSINNMLSDTMIASVTVDGFIPLWDTIKQISSVIHEDEGYRIFRKYATQTEDYRGMKNIQKQLNELRKKEEGFKITDIPRKFIEALQRGSEILELSTRKAVFERQLENIAKKSGVELQGAELEKALEDAGLDSVMQMPFGNGGKLSKKLNEYIPFFNPAMQGTWMFYNNLFKKDAQGKRHLNTAMCLKAAMLFTLPTIALALWNYRDDDSRERMGKLEDWEKMFYWHIDLGNGKMLRLRKPHLLGVLFASAPESVIRNMSGDEADLKVFANYFWEAMGPDYLPSVFKAFLEHAFNHNLRTGGDLIPRSEKENYVGSDQYGPNTSETAVGFAKAMAKVTGLELSPRVIENYVRNMTGTLGVSALNTADIGARKLMGKERESRDFFAKHETTRQFYVDSSERLGYEHKFRDEYEDLSQELNSVNRKLETSDRSDLDEKDSRLYGMKTAIGRVKTKYLDKIIKLEREIKEIRRDYSRNADDKRAAIDKKRERINEISRSGSARIQELRDNLERRV